MIDLEKGTTFSAAGATTVTQIVRDGQLSIEGEAHTMKKVLSVGEREIVIVRKEILATMTSNHVVMASAVAAGWVHGEMSNLKEMAVVRVVGGEIESEIKIVIVIAIATGTGSGREGTRCRTDLMKSRNG
jgi:hypothetical protein